MNSQIKNNENQPNLKSLSKAELLLSAEAAVKAERLSTLQVLHHFREIERRRLYLEKGYSSLFDMAVKHFGFSASGAQRRIYSMRLIRDLPEAAQKIESGELSLTAAASVQTFLKSKPELPKGERAKVLSSCLSRSSREVEKELAARQPVKDKRDDIRYSDADRLRLSLNISEDLFQKLEKLKYVLGLKKIEDVIQHLANKELSGKKPEPLTSTLKSLPAPVVQTRYIPKVTKRIVMKKNFSNQCEYTDPLTQGRCTESRGLQFDHIKPYFKGGPNLSENLRLLCGHHNHLVWHTEQKLANISDVER